MAPSFLILSYYFPYYFYFVVFIIIAEKFRLKRFLSIEASEQFSRKILKKSYNLFTFLILHIKNPSIDFVGKILTA